MLEAYIILAGMSIASFLGSLAYRLPRKLSILTPRSYCPACKGQLQIFELIPVLSYAVLRGRCRVCGYRIPVQYFIIELSLPLLYYGTYRLCGITPLFFCYVYLITLLCYLALVDIDIGTISFHEIGAVWFGGGIFIALSLLNMVRHRALDSVLGFALSATILLLSLLIVYLFKKRLSLGIADLFVFPGSALYFGPASVIRILLFSSLFGLATGGVLIWAGEVSKDFKFPMLPFMTAGVCVEILLFSY
jgi:leader peptidase (prepilin peptidase)/N-methyltransferase